MLDLSFGNNILIYGVIVSAVSFLVTLIATPKIIRSLITQGSVVQDYHKPGRPNVPRPAGPVLLGGIAAAEIILYFLTLDITIMAITSTTVIAFIVGFIDDRKVLPGWFKPAALIAAAIPLMIFGAHGTNLNLIFGNAFIPLLYVPFILVIIPIVVLNGVVTRFIIITTIPLLVSIAIFGNNEVFLAALPLLFGTIALYRYHKFPSRIFVGDSGTLVMGSMYGAVAIAGNSEIIGVIALLPAVMNSFLFLSSVKKIVEHRQVRQRPTILGTDFKLAASQEKNAPITLVRLILANGPLSEKEIGYYISNLAVFSSSLALISIFIQYYFLSGGI